MPAGSKVAAAEKAMRGKMPASEMYAILNKEGLKRGNKDTAKGRQAAKGMKKK
jgi:hypothetical protein